MGFTGRFKSSLLVVAFGLGCSHAGHADEGRAARRAAAVQVARAAGRGAGIVGLLSQGDLTIVRGPAIQAEQRAILDRLGADSAQGAVATASQTPTATRSSL